VGCPSYYFGFWPHLENEKEWHAVTVPLANTIYKLIVVRVHVCLARWCKHTVLLMLQLGMLLRLKEATGCSSPGIASPSSERSTMASPDRLHLDVTAN